MSYAFIYSDRQAHRRQILNPGTNTPLGYLPVSVSLCKLVRDISQSLYLETPGKFAVSFEGVRSQVDLLRQWYLSLPSHLAWGAPVAPSHRRPIAAIHLRYWDALMLATRPFLLCSVLRASEDTYLRRKAWFDEFSESCIDSAVQSLNVLHAMAMDKSFSSLTTFDCNFILQVVMVFLLALALKKESKYKDNILQCLKMLGSMESIGWCKKATWELTNHMMDLGIIDTEHDLGAVTETMSSTSTIDRGSEW